MIAVPDRQADRIFRAEKPVDFADLLISFSGAARVEKVIALSEDDKRTGGARDQEISHFESCRQCAGRHLLRVGGEFIFHIVHPGGDVTARSRHRQTVFQCIDESRHGSASGISCESDARRVHFRTAQQIIKPADRIPCAPRPHGFSRQQKLFSHDIVFPAATALEFRKVKELEPFALADGINGKDGVAFHGERPLAGLIDVGRFSVSGMPAEKENRRNLFRRLRQIEIAGYWIFRAAVIDDLVHDIGPEIKSPGLLCIQRRFFCGEREKFCDFCPDPGDIPFRILFGAQRFKTCFSCCEIFSDEVQIIILDRSSEQRRHSSSP